VGNSIAFSNGFYNGTTTSSSYGFLLDGTSNGASADSTNIVFLQEGAGLTQAATVTVDGTNIILQWTRTGSTTAPTMYLSWEVS
jgi:hypothetical protein